MNNKKKYQNINDTIRDAMSLMGYRAYVYFRCTGTDEGEAFDLAEAAALKYVTRFGKNHEALDRALESESERYADSPDVYESDAEFFKRIAKYMSGSTEPKKTSDR